MNSDEDDGHSFWSRPFTFGTVNLRVEELWGEGIALKIAKQGRCIELGAGVSALPSLVAAHLRCFSEVVATDIEECREGLQDNVAANLPHGVRMVTSSRPEGEPLDCTGWDEVKPSVIEALTSEAEHAGHAAPSALQSLPALSEAGTAVPNEQGVHRQGASDAGRQTMRDATVIKVHVLDWRDDVAFLGPPFDVVLVADVVYVAELAEPLLRCMWRLSDAASVILLAYYERSKAAHARFWELLPSYFNAVKIPESSYGVKEQSIDVGLFRLHRIEGMRT